MSASLAPECNEVKEYVGPSREAPDCTSTYYIHDTDAMV